MTEVMESHNVITVTVDWHRVTCAEFAYFVAFNHIFSN